MGRLLFLLPIILSVSASAANPVLWTARIQGSINPASSSYFQNAIHLAQEDHAQALIVELDTPGGLISSVREMTQAIDSAKIPVIVYVTPAGASATSAGALLMFASHLAAMAPGTNIGAAHPVGSGGEDIQGTMGEKVVNDTAAFARGLAELRGRNRELAEAVVSKSKSFTAEEALKNNLIDLVANNRDELIQKLDGKKGIHTTGAQIKTATMSFGQSLLHYLANPNIAGILMTLGMLLIYVELSHPGIAIAGIAGGICLLIAFMALQLLPIRVGGLAFLALGIALMIAEPFVTSHGAIAAGGIISFILGLIWVIDPSSTSFLVGPQVWAPAAIILGSLVALVAYAAARTQTLAAQALARIGGAKMLGLSGYSGIVENINADGLSGKAVFRGEVWDFVSDHPVKNGESVMATRVDGMRIHVQPKTKQK